MTIIKMRVLQQFLFLFKSKYRRKYYTHDWDWCNSTFDLSSRWFLVMVLLTLIQWTPVSFESESTGVKTPFTCGTVESFPCSGNGECLNNSCLCHPGWAGTHCQYCFGKMRLDGVSGRGEIRPSIGNYTSNMKCSWLIESPTLKLANGSSQTTHILLHIEEFATECGWDHLYIFDGDNVYAPLLSVFSGLLVQKDYSVLRLPEIVAKSGYALLHFYTDVAYNLTGFNITYRTRSCPTDRTDLVCSGNGVCVDQQECTCDAKWTGEACNIEKCPKNCSSQGVCDMELHKCQCWEGFKGHDCSQRADSDKGYWEIISPKSPMPKGSASSSAVVHNNSLWIIGGTNFNPNLKKPLLYRYDFKQNLWEKVQAKGISNFPVVYGQSCVLFESKIYMYGGVHDGKFGTRYISSSVWAFDFVTRYWTEVNVVTNDCRRSLCGPLQLAGHTAVVINDKGNKSRHRKMVVLLGHSPRYGYVNVVQEFHFGSQVWNVVKTRGQPVSGSYGHSSSWDSSTQKIYVFGGYRLSSDASLTNFLHSYDPTTHLWQTLEPGSEGRFLHSAVIFEGLLYVFGGNAHNDTAYSLGSRCFTSEVIVYDINCNEWSTIYPFEDIPSDLSRFGHISAVYEDSIYIWGGFNGLILNDLIRYTPPACDSSSSASCLNESLGIRCSSQKTKCDNHQSCSTCVQNKVDCVWCGSRCQTTTCSDSGEKAISSLEQCSNLDEITCGPILHNCPLCSSESNCIWSKDDQCLKDNSSRNGSEGLVVEREPIVCERSCSDYRTCTNCTSEGCIWCNNLSTCVDKNAYVISFPYGQCMAWSQSPNLCHTKDSRVTTNSTSQCSEIASCTTCLSLPSCGWCDSGTGTGLGECMDGSSRGPLLLNGTGAFVDKKACSLKQWNFTTCPACQCNGHSKCDQKNQCIACEGFMEGEHCEVCKPGYHGNAVNGGHCKTCECNSQAETCNPETGRCFCSTKGITGEFCERCDTQSNYAGDPMNGGSCFYDLQIDYQFTFNLSKKEDRHYSQINFKNSPSKTDTDADFQITCSVMSKMNISVKIAGLPEKFLEINHNCTNYKKRFLKTDYKFGSADNTTFYVYVYGFQPPLWIQISFSQSPKLDLLHFFITFSTCFLLLLVLAGTLWKFKQKYDMYRRRQRLFVEMEQLARRPFATVLILLAPGLSHEVGKIPVPTDLSSLRKCRKEWPGPIALEPCHGNRAAVLSCIVSLPTGGEPFVHPGQSGILVASALIALGNPRKVSFEPITKTEGKNSKLRKSLPSHSLNTCI